MGYNKCNIMDHLYVFLISGDDIEQCLSSKLSLANVEGMYFMTVYLTLLLYVYLLTGC